MTMRQAAPTLEYHREHVDRDGYYRVSAATLEIDRSVAVPKDKDHPFGIKTDFNVGTVLVTVCNTCLYTKTTCQHTVNTWDDEGSTLTCNACGMDVT